MGRPAVAMHGFIRVRNIGFSGAAVNHSDQLYSGNNMTSELCDLPVEFSVKDSIAACVFVYTTGRP